MGWSQQAGTNKHLIVPVLLKVREGDVMEISHIFNQTLLRFVRV